MNVHDIYNEQRNSLSADQLTVWDFTISYLSCR